MSAPEPRLLSDEDRAYRILGDRRSARVLINDMDAGWTILEFATSALDLGFVAVQYSGSDPVLLERSEILNLSRFLNNVLGGGTDFPAEPRPCADCGAVWHIPALCEAAEWDPTVGAGGPR